MRTGLTDSETAARQSSAVLGLLGRMLLVMGMAALALILTVPSALAGTATDTTVTLQPEGLNPTSLLRLTSLTRRVGDGQPVGNGYGVEFSVNLGGVWEILPGGRVDTDNSGRATMLVNLADFPTGAHGFRAHFNGSVGGFNYDPSEAVVSRYVIESVATETFVSSGPPAGAFLGPDQPFTLQGHTEAPRGEHTIPVVIGYPLLFSVDDTFGIGQRNMDSNELATLGPVTLRSLFDINQLSEGEHFFDIFFARQYYTQDLHAANLSGSRGSRTFNFDKTPPTLTFGAATPGPNGFGWNKADVSIPFTTGDNLSGVASASPGSPLVFSAEGTDLKTPVTVTDNAGNSATFTSPPVKIDKTPPTVAFGEVLIAGPGWSNTDVAVPFTASDNLSGIDTTTPNSPLLLTAEGTAVTGSVSATDKAGNSSSFTSPPFKIDKTPPVVEVIRTPGPNANGWNREPVTVEFRATDALSGIGDPVTGAPEPTGVGTATVNFSEEGASQSASHTFTDIAGNTAPGAVSNVNIDLTAPTLTFGMPTPAPNAKGWNKTDVSIPFTTSDNLSGVATTTSANPLSLTTEGDAVTASVGVTDKADNSATFTSPAVKIDKTSPVIQISPALGSTVELCGLTQSYTVTDALSGVASDGAGALDTSAAQPSGVGTQTYRVTGASDNADNTASAASTYQVVYGSAFSGFLQPINPDGSSLFKAGQTIQVKFQLLCNGTPITNAAATLSYAKISDAILGTAPEDETSVEYSDEGNAFRYDPEGQQYLFRLGTRGWATGTYRLRIQLDDGTNHYVNISLR